MKVVLDTNVFVSAIFWKGPPHEILTLAGGGHISIVCSQEMLDELFGVLARDTFQPYFRQARTNLQDTTEKVIKQTSLFPITEHTDIIKEDPNDNLFLACASTVNVSYIVSGDHHLLDLKQFRGIPILTPAQFLARFKRNTSNYEMQTTR